MLISTKALRFAWISFLGIISLVFIARGSDSSHTYTETDLLKCSTFVHLTNIFPKDGVLQPGATYYDDTPIPNHRGIPARSTLHFSWNHVLRPGAHSDKSLHNRKYIVLEKAKHVGDQFSGGYHEDVLIVGPYTLSEESMIFVPHGEVEEIRSTNRGFKGVLVDYDQGHIEKANACIREASLDLVIGSFGESGFPPWFLEFNGQQLPAETFLKPLWANRYWGLHRDWRLGFVDKLLEFLNAGFAQAYVFGTDCWTDYIQHPNEVRIALELLDFHRQKLGQELNMFPWRVREYLQMRNHELADWLRLINHDLYLRTLSKSIYIDKQLLDLFIHNRDDQRVLNELGERMGQHPILKTKNFERLYYGRLREELANDTPIFAEVMAYMPYEEAEEFRNVVSAKRIGLDDRFRELLFTQPKESSRPGKRLKRSDFQPLL